MSISRMMNRAALTGMLAALLCTAAFSQTPSSGLGTSLIAVIPEDAAPAAKLAALSQPSGSVQDPGADRKDGLIVRSARRIGEDQKELYLAPLKPSNFKWDVLFLGGAAALFATDMQVERAVPTSNVNRWHTLSAADIVGTSVTLGGLWAYGIKTRNDHAKETGVLELEALSNTFLVYTPMQLIAARERPDEGRGGGRFLVQHSFNTSFPAGHPMFTWTMASVVAHEYPKPWVQLLAYGAASSLSVARIMGRNHFASDVYVGSVLGYLIGSHIFHSRCMPGLSKACHREGASGK